ncbi:MAG: Rieske 2Fe-2S domain-containing protein [Pirellulales bacterium]|nr:Rieske 2Fe-2S domain-containing protein [Pirellulales bacterium]
MENVSSSGKNKPSCACGCAATPANEPRRGFLAKATTLVLGGAALGTPLIVGLISFLNPLRQKTQAGRFYRVATLEALPDDDTPLKFPIIADRKDAWTLHKNVPIGSVFLRRVGPKQIKALSVICPHAGCFIGYDAAAGGFLCPCHTAHFDLDGRREDPEDSPSPRDMDTLDGVEIRGDEIWVKYEQFQMGIAKKVVKR